LKLPDAKGDRSFGDNPQHFQKQSASSRHLTAKREPAQTTAETFENASQQQLWQEEQEAESFTHCSAEDKLSQYQQGPA